MKWTAGYLEKLSFRPVGRRDPFDDLCVMLKILSLEVSEDSESGAPVPAYNIEVCEKA